MKTYAVEYRTKSGNFACTRVNAANRAAAMDLIVDSLLIDYEDIQSIEERGA